MEYIRDIYKDEIRNGFLVTNSRKKIWQKEIEILLEIDRICKKYDIRYYADSGTLLGAVRHGGFVPWDDDIDIMMLRPDYEKFKVVAKEELSKEYILQNVYNDVFVSSFSKVMNIKTSAIEDWNDNFRRQGLFVDIFPYDIANNGTNRVSNIMKIAEELWMLIIIPHYVLEAISIGYVTTISRNIINQLLNMSYKERMQEYEKFMLRHFSDSEYVHNHVWCLNTYCPPINRKVFSDFVLMKFEGIVVPVPKDYDEVLKSYYGNWHEIVKGGSMHEGITMSADISYKEMLQKVAN